MRGTPWLLAGAFLAAVPAAADETKQFAGEVADLVELALQSHREVSAFPFPELDMEQLEELLEGKVLRVRWKQPVPGAARADGAGGEDKEDGEDEEEPKERHRVVALYLIESPRPLVWLAAIDPHMVVNERLTEAVLSTDGEGGSRWYQFMDLPWPVKNRHWVIDVGAEPEVAQATGGLAWEQPWHLVEDGEELAWEAAAAGLAEGLTLDESKGARYLEANTGAWTMFELSPDLTLLGYQLTVVLGGLIPEGLAARFAMGELKDLCLSVEENARLVAEHYDADHDRVLGGDGAPIVPPLVVP